ncbi:MAG: LamG-like jellyroll fold domain-containing protein, partial [Leadbetterella sp.]|nr:LamG-like jellyroll fold domain-containing protein [Leadbetterella sp.]
NSITAQMVSTSGSLIGNRISLGRTGKGPGVIYDGTNYLLVWFDNYNAVYGQFVKTSGNIVGSPFLIAPESAVSGKGNGFAFGDSTFIIVRTKNNIHYAQRVSKSGNLIGTPIQTSMTEAGENAIAFDGKNYLIAFRDQVYDKVIYGQFISESGELVGSNFIIDGGQYVSDNPVSIAFDGSRYLVAFHEQAADNNGWNLFARFVTPSGIVDPNRVTIRDSTYRPGMPQIAFDGTNYFITWVDNFFKPGSLIMGRYFNKAGIPINEAIKIFDSLGGKVPSYGIPTYGNNNFLIVTSRVSATNFTNGDVYGKFIATIPELKIEPYTFDSNTILLDHFDGTTSASILSYIEDYAPCGTVKQSATPNYSYGTGPNGLGQSLSLNAPIGQTSGSATYIKYPGGQLLSLPNGTLEFWVYFTSFGKGTAPFVDQGPYVGSCAGWTYYMTVDSTGQLRAGAWAAFTMTSGSMKIPLKTWTHVATTWGSAGAKLYINGVLVGSDTNTGMPASGYSGSVLMGLLTATGNISSIDELRISNIQRTKFNVGGSVENTQIPNGGFENWSTIGSYENPIGWATMNSVSTGPFYSCTKSTDHYPVSIGNYSIRLENNTSLTQWTGGYGMAVTHAFDYPFKPAFPIVDHPNKLCGYYKYNSMNNDSMFVRIVLFQKGVVVNYFTFITGNSTSTWKSFTLPMTYSSADSATLYFSAFWPNTPTDGPNGNSVLYIDNLSFDNLISSVPLSSSELPSKYSLTQNYPNPFNPTTKIKFGLVERSVVNLVVYDILGREVSTLVNQELDAGYHEVKFNAGNLSSGVYFYQLKSGLFVETKKLTLIK